MNLLRAREHKEIAQSGERRRLENRAQNVPWESRATARLEAPELGGETR